MNGLVPCLAACVDGFIEVGVDAFREVVFAEMLPNPFHRVRFGGIGIIGPEVQKVTGNRGKRCSGWARVGFAGV